MNIIITILLFLWQLPQNIVALIMYQFLFNKTTVAKRNYAVCYMSKSMNGGISLGNFVYVSYNLSKSEPHVMHELDGHTKQSKMLGPLYLLVIGIPSILWAAFRNKQKHPNYYSFYTEKWANKCANIEAYKEINGNYYLRKI